MTVDDFDEFCEVVVGFAELKGKQLSAAALKLYFRAMQSWDMREFKAAAEHLLCTCEFMPTPKDFTDLRRAGELTAGEAWDLVLGGAALLPNSREARAASIVGGQYAIRHADIERDLPHIQRRFMEAYAELSDVDSVREALPQIASPDYRIALRRPEPLSRIAARLERPSGERALPNINPQAVVPATPKPVPINASEKINALILLQMDLSDEEVARISGESIELVCEVRDSEITRVSAP